MQLSASDEGCVCVDGCVWHCVGVGVCHGSRVASSKRCQIVKWQPAITLLQGDCLCRRPVPNAAAAAAERLQTTENFARCSGADDRMLSGDALVVAAVSRSLAFSTVVSVRSLITITITTITKVRGLNASWCWLHSVPIDWQRIIPSTCFVGDLTDMVNNFEKWTSLMFPVLFFYTTILQCPTFIFAWFPR